MSLLPNPDKLRDRFHKLSATASSFHEEMDPLRDELARLVAGDSDLPLRDARAREAEIRAAIREKSEAHFPIEQERAQLARVLKAMGEDTGPLRDDAAYLANA